MKNRLISTSVGIGTPIKRFKKVINRDNCKKQMSPRAPRIHSLRYAVVYFSQPCPTALLTNFEGAGKLSVTPPGAYPMKVHLQM